MEGSKQSWEVVSEQVLESGKVRVRLQKDDRSQEVYATKTPLVQRDIAESAAAYRVRLAMLQDAILPVFRLRRCGWYTKGRNVYFCIAGDPATTEIRDDSAIAEARAAPKNNLDLLARHVLVRWGLGLASDMAKLRWRSFSGFPRPPGFENESEGGPGTLVLISTSLSAHPNRMGWARVAKGLEGVMGDYGKLVCDVLGIADAKQLSSRLGDARARCREIARGIDVWLVTTVDEMFRVFGDEARRYLAGG